jgi:ribosomal-protein-alanine N-acetyltransferase
LSGRGTIRAVSRLPERVDGPTTSVRRPLLADAAELLDLRRRNRAFVGPWDPLRPESFFTLEGQRAALRAIDAAWRDDRAYGFVVVDPADERIIGQASLSNVVRGAWQNATLGYWIDESSGGRGHASAAVRLLVGFAFGPAALHRLMPAVIPRNERSARVLRKNGFRLEGRALRYLQINGVWEDHDLYAMTAEEAAGLSGA